MRQSISKSRDYITNTVKTFTKYKPENAIMRGNTKIELFKADTGEKAYEMETENFISKVVEDKRKALANTAIMGTYCDTNSDYTSNYNLDSNYNVYLYGNGSSIAPLSDTFTVFSESAYKSLFKKAYYEQKDLFGYMVLTDYDAPEDPDWERATRGNIISYAQRQTKYTGAENRGSFNELESKITPTVYDKSFKFVYDFPTHAANGTINSIYFQDVSGMSSSLDYMDYADRKPYDPKFTEELNKYDIFFPKKHVIDGKEYVCAHTSDRKKIAMIPFDHDGELFEFTVNEAVPVASTASVKNNKDGIIFAKKLKNSNFIVFTCSTAYMYNSEGDRVNFPGASANNIANPMTTKSGYFEHASNVIAEGDSMYYQVNSNWNTNYIIYYQYGKVLDITDSKYTAKTTVSFGTASDTNSYSYITSPLYDSNGKLISIRCLGQTARYVNIGTDRVTLTDTTTRPAGKEMHTVCHILFKEGSVEIGNIATRNLLPEPIVKTSDYTMKITYELRFE